LIYHGLRIIPLQATKWCEVGLFREVVQVIAVVNTWKEHFEQVRVTTSDVAHLAAFIDGDELLAQRRDFDPVRFAVKGRKHKKA
jgi:hypothetical protein